jgi:plasmid stabilization system protein ParE
MQTRIIVQAEAEADAMEASRWYAQRGEGLGTRFLGELDDTITSIGNAPQSFPIYRHDIRRARIAHFPYAVFFVTEESHIRVLAIMNLMRDPRLIRRTLGER